MNQLLKLIEDRQSTRGPFDQSRAITTGNVLQILEAARWSPTAHNMQNFEIVVVDDQKLLDEIGTVQVELSEEFLREHLHLLSFSEEELCRKKVGLLASMAPTMDARPGPTGREVSEFVHRNRFGKTGKTD